MFWRYVSHSSSESKSKISQKPLEADSKVSLAQLGLLHVSAGFLLGLLFDPEGGKDVSLQNIGQSLNYRALQPRRLHSS
jgi:hypothetical protein